MSTTSGADGDRADTDREDVDTDGDDRGHGGQVDRVQRVDRVGWLSPDRLRSLPVVLVPAGLVLGALLSVLDVLVRADGDTGASWLGSLGAGTVAGMLTAVIARRVFGTAWPLAAIIGGALGLVVAIGVFGPDWLVYTAMTYAVAAAATVAVLLTRPVRGLAVLVIEYAIAFGISVCGATAVSGALGGSELSVGVAGAAVVAAFAAALLLTSWIRSRLNEREETTGDYVFVGAFILAVLVAASSAAVILASGGWSWAQTSTGVTVLVALSLALLGVGAVVRSWTPSGWWVSAPAALGAGAVAVAAGAGGMRNRGAAVLGVTIGFVAGIALTVVVAALIGMLVRANRTRPENIWRGVEEPSRFAPLR